MPTETLLGFDVVDTFAVDTLTFEVLKSRGGHIPGQVFFLGRDNGLLFTSDYLIDVSTLSEEDKDRLNVPRYLMTSTNTDSQLFKQESEALCELALSVDAELKSGGLFLLMLPGHGSGYRADRLSQG